VDDSDSFNPAARAAIYWTSQQLLPAYSRWLRELPAGPLERDGLVFIHGALEDEDEYVVSAADADNTLHASPSPISFFGHTHMQGGFVLRNERIETIRPPQQPGSGYTPIALDPGLRYLLNPGSVGQPRDGDPRAAFVLFDTGRRVVEFWRVPYDIVAVQKRMEEAGLPESLVLRLAFGR
jgi:diadenosine tetraphosphatase ApaH/serine/threonine PP2A family protein phosphatase